MPPSGLSLLPIVFSETQMLYLQMVLGEHDTSTKDESKIPRKEFKVAKIFLHEEYHHYDKHDDIALLKLSEKVNLNIYTPICLPNVDDDFTGKTAWAYGKKSELSFV